MKTIINTNHLRSGLILGLLWMAATASHGGSVIFTENFESGQGGWTTGWDGGGGLTVWQLGPPANVGPATANSGANCFGTNITTDYDLDANIWLRSPPIDLNGASSATLSYFQFRDIEEGFDFGEVSVLNAANNTVLAVIANAIDGTTASWEQITNAMPAAVLNNLVKFEFRFNSDEIVNLAGWYIDDVAVNVILTDSDLDGVPDNADACPNSDLSPTVVIDGYDSFVPNLLFPDGCTISDLIANCAKAAKNHGAFVSCVTALTNSLKQQGLISGQQKGKIQSLAAQANIP